MRRKLVLYHRHRFDPGSVLNPVTGRPYGPGPLWCGTEPMDYPDLRCTCGGLWSDSEGGCLDKLGVAH